MEVAMPAVLFPGYRLRTPLSIALALLVAATPVRADHGSAAFGTCMHASLIPGGPIGAGPFGGDDCGDGVPAFAWTVGTAELFAFGEADAATGTVRSHASTRAAGPPSGSAMMSVTSRDTLTFAADGDVTIRWSFDGDASAQSRPLVGQQADVAALVNLGPTFGWTYYNDDAEPYHPGHHDIQGEVTLQVSAGQPFFVFQSLQTHADGAGVVVDFSHTGRLAFDLPPQQRLTSASGAFLSVAVPEPATALSFTVGLALIVGPD
jgi:hypothetical protein